MSGSYNSVMRDSFNEGDFILRQEILDGREWIAYPVRVVADAEDALALYLDQGTPMRFGEGDFRWGVHPWAKLEPFWQSEGVLQVQRPRDAYAVWMFQAQGRHSGSYINFQSPFRRTTNGIVTLDHELDLWIPADGSPYRWKDVAEFEHMAASGLFTATQAADVRAQAHTVESLVKSGDVWWEPWTKWSAPGDWSAPDISVLQAHDETGRRR
jgi:Protein of unknown function (DUF402)